MILVLDFIKMFGLGILYTILSPFVVLGFALFLVYSLFNYLVCEAIGLSGFFFGKKFSAETELDKQCKKLKKERAQERLAAEEAGQGGDLND